MRSGCRAPRHSGRSAPIRASMQSAQCRSGKTKRMGKTSGRPIHKAGPEERTGSSEPVTEFLARTGERDAGPIQHRGRSRVHQRVFNEHNPDLAFEYLTPGVRWHGGTLGTIAGLESVTALRRGFIGALPDLHAAEQDVAAAGDTIAVEFVVEGTHEGHLLGIAPTGRRVRWDAVDVYRLANGRSVEEWAADDLTVILQQVARSSGHRTDRTARLTRWADPRICKRRMRWTGFRHPQAPQGGVASPILSSIYLHKLDQFVETVLVPEYTRGDRRARNPAYLRLQTRLATARRRGDRAQARTLRRQLRRLPSADPNDPAYRRLRYCRYADLCRARHKSAYAEVRVMPTRFESCLVRAVGGFLMSA